LIHIFSFKKKIDSHITPKQKNKKGRKKELWSALGKIGTHLLSALATLAYRDGRRLHQVWCLKAGVWLAMENEWMMSFESENRDVATWVSHARFTLTYSWRATPVPRADQSSFGSPPNKVLGPRYQNSRVGVRFGDSNIKIGDLRT
jgi:hypothetical protein